MSFTQTPNYGLYKPTVNADNDQWGNHWNTNADRLDSTLGGNSGRNLVHNPLFAVAQRGAGPFTTITPTIDRWVQSFGGGSQSTTQIALADADRTAIGDEAAEYALQSVVVGGAPAASYTGFGQGIEDVRRLGGKTVVVSFWAKAASGTPKLGVSMDQNFGTGGSPSANVTGTGQAVTLSTTWTRYSLTLTSPSTAGKTLGTNGDHVTTLYFWFSAGTTNNGFAGGIGVQSGTFTLWGMQLEIGSVATPLEKPDPRYDLANCLRFFQLHYAVQLAGNAAAAGLASANSISFPAMRATPAAALSGQAYFNATAVAVVPVAGAFTTAQTTITASAAGQYVATFNVALSADL